MLRIRRDRASRSAFCDAHGRKLGGQFGRVAGVERGVVRADKEIGLGAELLGLGFRVRTFVRSFSISLGKPLARAAGLILLRLLLQRQVGVGDGVGDLALPVPDPRDWNSRDDPRALDGRTVSRSKKTSQHPLLRRHLQRVAAETERAQECAEQRHALQHRVEFRAFARD